MTAKAITTLHLPKKIKRKRVRLNCLTLLTINYYYIKKFIISPLNKIAQKKLDLFTYNNIKGRAGRMFRYFVGRVFVLNEQPDDELPFIDIPVLSVPDDISVTLALNLPEKELSDYTKEQLLEQIKVLEKAIQVQHETINKMLDAYILKKN